MHVPTATFIGRIAVQAISLKALKKSEVWIRDSQDGIIWVPSIRGNNKKWKPIKVFSFVTTAWMVEVMRAIAFGKSTKTRKFKMERNKVFTLEALLGLCPSLVVSFLAKCDTIPGSSLYKTLGLVLLSCARQADALLANKAGASKPCSLK